MYPELEDPDRHHHLPAGALLYRVQLAAPRPDSVQLNGFNLPPTGLMTGRFDLVDEPVAYLASSRRAALLESVFRRDLKHQTLEHLQRRVLATVKTLRNLVLVDLRGLEQEMPFLVAGRYGPCRELAQGWRVQGADGVVYTSPQHPGQCCVVLFEPGLRAGKIVRKELLVSKGRPLQAVLDAARVSAVPLI